MPVVICGCIALLVLCLCRTLSPPTASCALPPALSVLPAFCSCSYVGAPLFGGGVGADIYQNASFPVAALTTTQTAIGACGAWRGRGGRER
jgi:hypothetical protein